jgi:hypothetical protein
MEAQHVLKGWLMVVSCREVYKKEEKKLEEKQI